MMRRLSAAAAAALMAGCERGGCGVEASRDGAADAVGAKGDPPGRASVSWAGCSFCSRCGGGSQRSGCACDAMRHTCDQQAARFSSGDRGSHGFRDGLQRSGASASANSGGLAPQQQWRRAPHEPETTIAGTSVHVRLPEAQGTLMCSRAPPQHET